MLIGVNCLNCGKAGSARYMYGQFGISYSAWLCPECRKLWREGKLPHLNQVYSKYEESGSLKHTLKFAIKFFSFIALLSLIMCLFIYWYVPFIPMILILFWIVFKW